MASSEKAAAMTAAPIYQSPIPPQPVGRRSTSPERQLAGAVLVMLPQQDEQSFAGFLTELTLRVIRPPCVFRIGGLNRCCHVAQHDHCSTSSRVLVNRPLVAAAAPPDLFGLRQAFALRRQTFALTRKSHRRSGQGFCKAVSFEGRGNRGRWPWPLRSNP